MGALQYESFIRNAFELSELAKGNESRIERGGDPASFAEADYFNMAHLPEYMLKVKIGTSYAMGIYINLINEQRLCEADLSDEQRNDFQEIMQSVIGAQSSEEINNLIGRFIAVVNQINCAFFDRSRKF